jgi:tetratricopeptide (TPR) repeat protein
MTPMPNDLLIDTPAHYREALSALRQGNLAAADLACRALVAEQPAFAPGLLTASNVRLRCGDPPGALVLVERALSLASRQPRALIQRAQCLLALNRLADAETATLEAEQLAADDAVVQDAAGTVHSFLGHQELALAAYERALALQPGDPGYLFNRATVRRFLGDLAGAESDYDRVLAVRPDDYEAYKNRSDLRRQRPDRNHVESLRAALARPIPTWAGEVQLHHALAKEYEDLGRYQDAWEALGRGAQLRRRHLRYDVSLDEQTVDWIIGTFGRPPTGDMGYPGNEPIFIVGLPRSGTTLVERILSSHPAVSSAGERNDFARLIVEGVAAAGGTMQLPRRELIARSAHIDFRILGRAYVEGAPPTDGTAHFIDKMPLNYLYVGLIRRALPRARVIHLTRHPMAACYAMYKTLFKDGYPFSYDLEEIARYYLGYRRLMAHWRAVLPHYVYEQPYEALVADQRGETRGLLEFCGLPWDEACIDFHRNPAATTTASAAQVREPIYSSSLGQWQHYATELEDLRRRLLAGGITEAELAVG